MLHSRWVGSVSGGRGGCDRNELLRMSSSFLVLRCMDKRGKVSGLAVLNVLWMFGLVVSAILSGALVTFRRQYI